MARERNGEQGPDDADGDVADRLQRAVDELYSAMPEGFVAARTGLAKQARGDGHAALAKQLDGLRKPTTAAWLVNALVRHRAGDVDQLLDLGQALRTAQASLAGDQLRELTKQRQQVVSAMARQARALARELGNPVSQAVTDEVEETLRAALADPEVAEAVRSGRLTASLSYAGLGETGPARVADVIALAPRRADRDARKTADTDDAAARQLAAELSALRAALDRANRAADDGHRLETVALEAFAAAQQHHDETRERVRTLQAQVQEAQAELTRAGEDATARRRERDAAQHAAAVADRAAVVARQALDERTEH